MITVQLLREKKLGDKRGLKNCVVDPQIHSGSKERSSIDSRLVEVSLEANAVGRAAGGAAVGGHVGGILAVFGAETLAGPALAAGIGVGGATGRGFLAAALGAVGSHVAEIL